MACPRNHSNGGKSTTFFECVVELLAYADDVNILGGSIHTLKENPETLVAATREIGLEVLIKLSTWSCLEIRMQDEFTV